MEEKLNGIVLGGTNYGENDKILNVFTLEKGVICARIKGVKKAGAKLKFAAEPFCFVEFIFSKTADKRTVIGATLIDSFYPLRENVQKYFCAGAVVEFVKKFYKEEMVDEREFLLTVNALKEIAYTSEHLSALVKFLTLALKNVGFALSPSGCYLCKKQIEGRTFFDYRNGAFLCEECFDGLGREISPITLVALFLAEKGQLLDSHEGTKKAIRLLDYYILNRAEEQLNSIKELLNMIF